LPDRLKARKSRIRKEPKKTGDRWMIAHPALLEQRAEAPAIAGLRAGRPHHHTTCVEACVWRAGERR
jgi:hypothetical protein